MKNLRVILMLFWLLGGICLPAQSLLYLNNFSCPTMDPIWQPNLPNGAHMGSFAGSTSWTATYEGAPFYSFGALNSNSVLNVTDNIGPVARRGWCTDTNFFANNFRYEIRFNSLYLSSTSSVDGFVEIWLLNSANSNLYDIVSPFAGNSGADPYMFFGSSIDNNYVQGSYAVGNHTWYRLALQCLPGQDIRESLCDDNDNELDGYTLAHGASSYSSGFELGLSQAVGFTEGPYPTAVSIDYAILTTNLLPTVVTQPQSQTVAPGSSVTFSAVAEGVSGLTYQWYYNGTALSGKTSSTLTLTSVQASQTGSYYIVVRDSYGSTTSYTATLSVLQFLDNFPGPALNSIWQTNLPNNAHSGSFPWGYSLTATYLGAPDYGFGTLDSASVINMTNVIGPNQRVGWDTSTNFSASNWRYEARFNSLYLSPTSSIDGFIEIWLLNSANSNLFDIVSPFAGDSGTDPYMFFGSSIDGSYIQGSYQVTNNTWYRLALQCLPGQDVRASLCDDKENELTGYTFEHGSSSYGSAFKLGLSQIVGESYAPYPTAVSVDYVSLSTNLSPTVITQPQSQTVTPGTDVAFSVIAEGASGLTYQWYYNGTELSGQTNSVLDLTDAQAFDDGSYYVVVGDSYGTATSAYATLCVGPLVITTNSWTLTGSMYQGSMWATATLLTNGEVLVAGGDTLYASYSQTLQLYYPSSGGWAGALASLNTGRIFHTATLLTNGSVLIVGGEDSSGGLASAELYNPATGECQYTGSLHYPRWGHTATLLTNGQVLVTGGYNGSTSLSSSEIYDPGSASWSVTGSLGTPRVEHTATLLPNGQVLAAGGVNGEQTLNSAEIYDPGTATWSGTASLNQGRSDHTATLLNNGDVLVAGGYSSDTVLSAAEIYDPSLSSWSTVRSLNTARAYQTANLLPNGWVLVAGGQASDGSALSSSELYNPGSGVWTNAASLNYGRYYHTATLLQNGQVMAAGGLNDSGETGSAELFNY